MRRAKRIVFALRAFGEAGKSATLPQRTDTITSSGYDLVWIGLMSNVPDQPVFGRVEHIVQSDRKLDHPKTGAQVTAGVGHGVDCFGA